MRIGAGTRRAFGVALLIALAAPGALLRPLPSLAQAVPLRVIDNGEAVPLSGDAIVQNGVVMAPYQGLAVVDDAQRHSLGEQREGAQ